MTPHTDGIVHMMPKKDSSCFTFLDRSGKGAFVIYFFQVVTSILKVIIAIIITAVSLTIHPELSGGTARGNEWIVDTSVSVRETYDDNLLFTEDNPLKDFYTTFTPSLNGFLNAEKNRFDFTSSADFKKYSRENDMDSKGSRFDFRTGISWSATPTPLSSHFIKTGYMRDTSVDSELETTGRPIADKDILSVTYVYRKWRSSKNLIRMTIDGQHTMYKDSAYMDYSLGGGLLEWGHALDNERLTLYGGIGYHAARGDMDDYRSLDATSEVKGGTMAYGDARAGFIWEVSLLWKLEAFYGIQYIDITYDPHLIVYQGRANMLVDAENVVADTYTVRIRRDGEMSRLRIWGGRHILPSGEDLSIDSMYMNMDWQIDLTDYFTSAVTAGWRHSRSVSRYFTVDSETCFGALMCRHEFTDHIVAELSFRQSWLFDYEYDTKAVKNVVYVGVTINWNTLL